MMRPKCNASRGHVLKAPTLQHLWQAQRCGCYAMLALVFGLASCVEAASLAAPADVERAASAFLAAARLGDEAEARRWTVRSTANDSAFSSGVSELGEALRRWGEDTRLRRYELHIGRHRPNAHRLEYAIGSGERGGYVILWLEREDDTVRVETFEWR